MICNTLLCSFGETEAVETWRSEKLKEAKELIQEQNGVNSTVIVEEAGIFTHLRAITKLMDHCLI